MPPEQTNTPVPESAPVPVPPPTPAPAAPVAVEKGSHTILIVVAILLACIVGALSYAMYAGLFDTYFTVSEPVASMDTELTDKASSTPNPQFVVGTQVYSNRENIQFTLPSGWTLNGDLNLPHPDGSADTSLSLEKAGSACVIAVQNRYEESGKSTVPLKQMSFATRVFSDFNQYDGNWYVASTSASAAYEFSSHERQFIAGEFRSSGGGDHNFLLWTKDGTAVPEECDSDLNLILETVQPYYEQVKLDMTSVGTLVNTVVADHQLGMSEEGGVNLQNDDSYESLTFTADGLDEKREVMKFPDFTGTKPFFVVDDKLYVQMNDYDYTQSSSVTFDAAIYMIDPIAAQVTVVPGSAVADRFISSIYVKDGVIYYLAGDSSLGSCLGGYGPCPASLYSIPLTGGTSTFITKTSVGGSIWGYVESEQALYLARSAGDAGCGGSAITKVVNGKEEPVGEYTACVGDTDNNLEYQEMEKAVATIRDKASAAKVSGKAIRIENGTLSPVAGDPSDRTTFYFDK